MALKYVLNHIFGSTCDGSPGSHFDSRLLSKDRQPPTSQMALPGVPARQVTAMAKKLFAVGSKLESVGSERNARERREKREESQSKTTTTTKGQLCKGLLQRATTAPLGTKEKAGWPAGRGTRELIDRAHTN